MKLRNVANINTINSRDDSLGKWRNSSTSVNGLSRIRLVNVIETQEMEPDKENAELHC